MTDWHNPPQAPQRSTLTTIGVALVVISLMAAMFGGGYWIGSREAASSPDMGLTAGEISPVSPTTSNADIPPEVQEQFQVYWQAWNIVNQSFYHTEPISQDQMIYGSIRGMLQSLGDEFTYFYEPQTAEQAREDLSGQFEGIGAYVEFTDGTILIQSPIEGSPAAKAGVLAGDIVVAVDGVLMSEITANLERGPALDAAIKLIRGPKGTPVTLTLYRPSEESEFKLEIIRDTIPLISVRSAMLGDVGYIAISEFKQTTYDELDAEIKELQASNPRAYIIDLRNNPGGFVNQAQNVVGRFVPDGLSHIQVSSDGTREEYPVRQNGEAQTLFDAPLVILVNEGSASASEIVSGALQDAERAPLLGTKTFGKGSVQHAHDLLDGSQLRVTVAQWLTPAGREIHREGIEPDYAVPFDADSVAYPVECLFGRQPLEDESTCGDSQLFWALKLLEGETPPPPPAPTPTPTPGTR